MAVGLFLRRECQVAARRGDTYYGRVFCALAVAAVLAACMLAWDYWGWDRASVAGAQAFGLAAFGLSVAMMLLPTCGGLPVAVAQSIARERDRKTLDALLATRLTAAEIVLGATCAGLIRSCAATSAVVPIAVLVVYLGGIDLRWIWLVLAGLGSTALALAALATAVSVSASTARRAVGGTLLWMGAWFYVPVVVFGLTARGWPPSLSWVRALFLWILDSTPYAAALHVAGVVRRASLPGALVRMIALQLCVTTVLLLWAMWRLRPASRALYDRDGRASLLRTLRIRRRSRPPCGDDPVLWNEMHSTASASDLQLLIEHIFHALWVVALVIATATFAVPAFSELFERGYGAAPEAARVPDVHPVARLVVNLATTYGRGPAPGQARLEFNIVLRQATAFFGFILVLVIAGGAAETIVVERERDTWPGLLATPLCGAEILRAKMLGVCWRARGVAFWIIGPWVVGVLTGAIHPVGLAAALIHWGIAVWFCTALGVYAALRSGNRDAATTFAIVPLLTLALSALLLVILPVGTCPVLAAAGSTPFIAWAALLSYEDVAAALTSGQFPQLAGSSARAGDGAWMVLATWAIGTIVQLVAAYLLTRAAIRGFDRAVGRPTRPPASESAEERDFGNTLAAPVRLGL